MVSRLQIGGTDLEPRRARPAAGRGAGDLGERGAGDDRGQGGGAGRARVDAVRGGPRADRGAAVRGALRRTPASGRTLCAAVEPGRRSPSATPGSPRSPPARSPASPPADAARPGAAPHRRSCASTGAFEQRGERPERRARRVGVVDAPSGRRARPGRSPDGMLPACCGRWRSGERRARLAVRHRHVAAARTDDVVGPDRRAGRAALHRPGHRLPVGRGADAHPGLAALDDALYADRTPGPAPRDAPHAVGLRPRRRPRRAPRGHPRPGRGCSGSWCSAMLEAGGIADPEGWLADGRRGDRRAAGRDRPADRPGGRAPGCRRWRGAGAGGQREVRHHPGARTPGCCWCWASRAGWLRARPTGTWINGQYRWAARRVLAPRRLRRTPTPTRAGRGRAGPALAADASARAPGPTCSGGPAGRWPPPSGALADVGAVEVELAEGHRLPAARRPRRGRRPRSRRRRCCPGWTRRRWAGSNARSTSTRSTCRLLFDRNGNGGPTLWVDGRVVGGWAQRKDGEIVLRIMADVGAEARAALQRSRPTTCRNCSARSRFSVRFPAPLQQQL